MTIRVAPAQSAPPNSSGKPRALANDVAEDRRQVRSRRHIHAQKLAKAWEIPTEPLIKRRMISVDYQRSFRQT